MREINDAYGLFVTANDEVYFYPSSQCNIYASPINATIIYPVMLVSKCCDDIFIDLNNTLYCSIHFMNQIITKSLDAPGNTLRSVAGTGSPGSESDQLYDPYGIFVDISFDLYVADSVNNRIQRFSSGQMNATTVAGNGTSGTIFLKTPMDILLDGDGYLFIVDSDNNRIVGSGPGGFFCVAGCLYGAGWASNQLSSPSSMSFDSYGNMWVSDSGNGRVQKFFVNNVSNGMCYLNSS